MFSLWDTLVNLAQLAIVLAIAGLALYVALEIAVTILMYLFFFLWSVWIKIRYVLLKIFKRKDPLAAKVYLNTSRWAFSKNYRFFSSIPSSSSTRHSVNGAKKRKKENNVNDDDELILGYRDPTAFPDQKVLNSFYDDELFKPFDKD